jgi:dienelactone hydrolase
MYASSAAELAAYIPFHPDCNTTYLKDEQISEKPIRIFHGSADNYVPVEPSRNYAERLRRAGNDVELTEYAGAHHVFDNPLYRPHRSLPHRDRSLLARRTGQRRNRQRSDRCAVFQWTDACVKRGTTVGYDPVATAQATEAVKSFLTWVFRR